MSSAPILFIRQCQRELLIQTRQIRQLFNSCLFLLIFLLMFPLTLKPEIELLRTIVPGLVWMAILLSTLLSSEHLFRQDYEHGVMEQWLISGRSLSLLISAKVFAHWLFNLIPLIIMCPLVALLFSLNAWESLILALTILCGTPTLLFLCALVAAFGVGMSQKGMLMALILLPLTLPVLILSSGTLASAMQGMPVSGYLALLLALSVMSTGFLPYAIAGVIRVSHTD